jgi:D-alanyl-D-alanine carboxypeptidase
LGRKRLLLYLLLPTLALGAVWLVGVGVRGMSQGRAERSAAGGGQAAGVAPPAGAAQAAGGTPEAEAGTPRAGAAARRAALGRRLEELIEGHPGYPLEEAAGILEELSSLPPRPRAGVLDSLEARVLAVETALRSEATGVSPGQRGWEAVLGFKTFSPNGFRDLYERTAALGAASGQTPPPGAAPVVTGDPAADRRIAGLALARGYRLRAEADEGRLEGEGHHRLQPEAMAAWRRLQAAARADGVELALVSAYRSVARQRTIFLGALARAGTSLQGRAPTAAEVASGQADTIVESVLRESSPPGFSRHHTGCTIDITDAGSGLEFTEFGRTDGYRWISRTNYLNAKRFGFIPSYPPGATDQGPDPEPWEYVWVGAELLESGPAPAAPSPPSAGQSG